jgi:exodeoxyribonuclease-3
MKRFPSCLASILIALLFLFSSSCNSVKKETHQAPSSIKIISYNVWYGFTKVAERKQTWLGWMQKQDPDVVSLQELNGYNSQILADDALSYGHGYSALLKEDGFPTGITSRYPIEDIQKITEGFHHGLLRVRIQEIYFYVIHLHPSNWEFRLTEIRLILEDIKSLPPESKVILAGDFNTFSPLDSVYYEHGRLEPFFNERDSAYGERNLNMGRLDYTVIQEVMDFGFIDLEAGKRSTDYTFSGSFPTRIEKEGEHGDLRRLDYVFASPNLIQKNTGAKIISSDTAQILSDHLPVVVHLGPVSSP